jgi:hypothetical protein
LEINNRKDCEILSNHPGLIANFHFNQGVDSQNNSTVATLLNSTGGLNGTLTNFGLNGANSNWRDIEAVTAGVGCTYYPNEIIQTGNTLSSPVSGGSVTYQWYSCTTSLPVAGENSQFYSPTVSGSYYVALELNGCSISSDCASIIVTAINENNTTNSFNIYPNPTSSTLNIEVKEQTQITIVNVLGEVVKTETIKGLSTIDVTELSTGVYFIQSNTGIKTKFIKQ